ncbi:unnamed protein product [Brassica oleracea]
MNLKGNNKNTRKPSSRKKSSQSNVDESRQLECNLKHGHKIGSFIAAAEKQRRSLKSQARHNEEGEPRRIGVVSTSFREPPSSPPQSSSGSNSLTVLSFYLMYTDLLETSPMTTSNPTQLALDLR